MPDQDDISELMRIHPPTGIPERIVPGRTDRLETAEHMGRYGLAARTARGVTLDLGAGVGYGAAMLATSPRGPEPVIAIDLDSEAVAYGKRTYDVRIKFVVADAARLPLAANSLDTVVCLEAIEHVPSAEKLLREIERVLSPTGLLIISSPNKWVTSPLSHPRNPYHVREWYPRSFIAFVSRYFEVEEIFGQSFVPRRRVLDVMWGRIKPNVKLRLKQSRLLGIAQLSLRAARRITRSSSIDVQPVVSAPTTAPLAREVRAAWPQPLSKAPRNALPITMLIFARRRTVQKRDG